ncbi:MAG TPA: MarR family transcriptional regulator [Longimicrobium sp.]|nr:MarR family transcriptional regulator [Longimicrobium sp.]
MALEFLSPLHKASRQISVYLEAHTRELGVSPAEGHVITYLGSYGPVQVGELVRVFGMKQSTLTSMLDRLERAGMVLRVPNPDDRRSFLVDTTDYGVDLAIRLTNVLTLFEEEIRECITDQELAGFRAVMAAVDQVTRVQLRER